MDDKANKNQNKNSKYYIKILNFLGISKEIRNECKEELVGILQTIKVIIQPRHIKTIIVFTIILIFLTYKLCPSRWFYILWGLIALFVGPILNELAKKWDQGKQFFGVIFISIMVALGGLLSTLGWIKWTNFKEDQSMLISVATEWIIMDTCIDTTRKVIQHDITNESGNTLPYIIIPALNESNYAVTHSETVRCDPELKHVLTVYVMGALKFDQAYQHLMQAVYLPFKDKSSRKRLLESFVKEGFPLDYLSQCHEYLGDYMKRKYPKIMNLAEQQADIEYLDAIKCMEFVSVPEDSNSVR
ncbi:MAG: hypothetical protein LUQ65_03590 [Candidatus Helarchaeota archaeon]|nr:hypothetical protein [Candidatus Helarchaeota archaeon]